MNLHRWSLVVVLSLISIAPGSAAPPKVPPPSNSLSFLNWGDSPEAYLLTNEERAEWAHVLSAPAAEAFIAAYWQKHGPGWRNLVMSRIVAADKFFPLGDMNGSETRRGRVFIILGAPNRQQSNRSDSGSSSTGPGSRNSIEQRALVGTVWTYKSDRLPKALGVPELVVHFQTDVQRGYETIENPGLIEPYLKRAAQYFASQALATASASSRPGATAASTPTAGANPVPSDDIVWSGNALNGAIFIGDTFVSPTDNTFYAVDFYLPKAVFATVDQLSVAGVIRDATGKQLLSLRTPSKALTYDARGDRFVDASFELPPGHYTGAFALTTTDGKLLAAKRTEFDVRALAQPGVSSLFLTSRIDTLETQAALDPFTFVAMKYVIKGDRQFTTSDKIGYFVVIANPTLNPGPSFMLKMKITKDGKAFGSTPSEPANLTQTSARTFLVANQFAAGTFPVGHYTLQVALRDLRAEKNAEMYSKGYVQTTEFDVVP